MTETPTYDEMKNPYFMKAVNGKKVSVIGACGRIGLPLTYIIAKSGYMVTAIDLNKDIPRWVTADDTPFPYIEDGFRDLGSDYGFRWKTIYRERVTFTDTYDSLADSDYIVVIVGTPVDGENNPRVENIIELFDKHIIPVLRDGQTIILRSTVFPGMTDLLEERIFDARTNFHEVPDYSLVFAPERVSQGHSLEETTKLPQLIGSYNTKSANRAEEFFKSLNVSKVKHMLPLEAEYGKLITNMYRYVNIAFANEVYMMTANKAVNIHKVIEAANADYPRMDMPRPGPNAAGPCLFKDGKLLVDDTPYGDLVNVAFHINEGMPKFVFNLTKDFAYEHNLPLKKVAILGMTFKRNIDDIRFSESYKLKKILIRNGIEVVEYDEYLGKTNVEEVDAVIVMTPHDGFTAVIKEFLDASKHEIIVADAWGHSGLSWHGNTFNGIYKVSKNSWL